MKTTTQKINQQFTFKAPAAGTVLLAGDFTGWQKNAIPLKPRGDGLWQVTTSLSPGTHHYRFIVDGEWRDDPDCVVRVPNPFGTANAIRVVPVSA